jgi:hypothetical protein
MNLKYRIMNKSTLPSIVVIVTIFFFLLSCKKDNNEESIILLTNVDLTSEAQLFDTNIVSLTIDNVGFFTIEYTFFPENLILSSTGTLAANNDLNNMGFLEYNITGKTSGNLITSIEVETSGGLNQTSQNFTDLEVHPITNGNYHDMRNRQWHIKTSINLLFDNNGQGSFLQTDGNRIISFTGRFLRPSDNDAYTTLSVDNTNGIDDPYKLGVFESPETYTFTGLGAVTQEEDGFTIKIKRSLGNILRYDLNEFDLIIYDKNGGNIIDEATLELIN